MMIQVKMFAAARDAAGKDEVTCELPAGATAGDLRRALSQQFPELARYGDRLLLAVDSEYAGDNLALAVDQEIACIPPVSGG